MAVVRHEFVEAAQVDGELLRLLLALAFLLVRVLKLDVGQVFHPTHWAEGLDLLDAPVFVVQEVRILLMAARNYANSEGVLLNSGALGFLDRLARH